MSHLFVKASLPTPVLNTPHFSSVFGGENADRLLLDEKGHMRALEFVAFPKTCFQVLKKFADHILQVAIPSYEPNGNFFIDSRFAHPCHVQKEEPLSCPATDLLLSRLEKLLGISYLWGGNYSAGIPELLSFYPPSKELDLKTKNHWMLKGADCTGILYEITEGQTPRNSSALVRFGEPLMIEGFSPQKILLQLRPLDLIVFVGHLIIVFDPSFTIESREHVGVVKNSIEQRLEELFLTRKPRNSWPSQKELSSSSFVIRRWKK